MKFHRSCDGKRARRSSRRVQYSTWPVSHGLSGPGSEARASIVKECRKFARLRWLSANGWASPHSHHQHMPDYMARAFRCVFLQKMHDRGAQARAHGWLCQPAICQDATRRRVVSGWSGSGEYGIAARQHCMRDIKCILIIIIWY